MNQPSFDHLTRRASLASIAAAGLAGVLGHAMMTEAKQSASKKARKKCKKQVSQCLESASVLCGDSEECEQRLPACCQLLSTCDFNAFLICGSAADE